MSHAPKPILLYDGNCGFCRTWVERWKHTTGDRVEYAPFQEAGPRFPEIPTASFAEAVHLIEPDGRRSRGAEAVFRALAYAPGRGFPLLLYRRLPGFSVLAECLYRFIARSRPAFSRWTRRLP